MLVFAGFQVAVEVFHVDWSSCQKLIHLTHDTFVGLIIDNAPGIIDKKKSIPDIIRVNVVKTGPVLTGW